MNKKTFLIFTIISLVFLGGIVYAEESLNLNGVENKNLSKEKQAELKNEMKQNRTERRTEINQEIKNAREEFQQKLKLKREENKERLIRNKEVLKAKLKIIKDENKQKAVLNINENISKINEKTTDRLGHLVNTIEEILERIENKMNIVKEQDFDISSVETSIQEAKIKITETKDLIEIQAGKIYKLEITDELNFREEIKIIRNTLSSDLKNLQNEVKSAHAYTREAAQRLGEIMTELENENEESEKEDEDSQDEND